MAHGIGHALRQDQPGAAGERRVVSRGQPLPLGEESFEAPQLVEAERRLDVHHVVLESGNRHVVARASGLREALPGLPVHSVELQERGLLEDGFVLGHDHAPFPGRHVLVGVEGEHRRRREGPDPPALVLRADGMRGVLEHGDPAGGGELEDRIEVRRLAHEVDRQDHLRSRREPLLDLLDPDVQSGRVDVREDGPGAAVDDRVERRHERHGRRHDFVARADSEREERDVQARGRRGDRHGIAAADVLGERGGETLDLRPRRDPAGGERIEQLLDFLGADGRTGERKERLSHR